MVSNFPLLRPVWSSNCFNDLLCIWHTCNCRLSFLCCCGLCTCCCTPLFEQEPPSTPPSTLENSPSHPPRLLLSRPALPSLPVKDPAPEGDQPPPQSPSSAGIARDTTTTPINAATHLWDMWKSAFWWWFYASTKSEQFFSSQVMPIPPTVQHLVLTTLWCPMASLIFNLDSVETWGSKELVILS